MSGDDYLLLGEMGRLDLVYLINKISEKNYSGVGRVYEALVNSSWGGDNAVRDWLGGFFETIDDLIDETKNIEESKLKEFLKYTRFRSRPEDSLIVNFCEAFGLFFDVKKPSYQDRLVKGLISSGLIEDVKFPKYLYTWIMSNEKYQNIGTTWNGK